MHAKLDHLEQVEELCAGGGTGTLEKSECQRMKKNVEEQQQLFEAHPETVAFIFSSSKALGINYCHLYAHGSIGGNGIGGVVQCADANLVWNQHHHFFFAALHINLGACNVGFVIAANYFSGALVSISIGRWSHWAWALKSLYTTTDCH